MQNRSAVQKLIALVIVMAVIFAAYTLLTMPDRRSSGQRIGDAFHELPNGVGKAGRELEDRTPGQKIGDGIKDAGEKVKDTTSP